MAYLRNLQTNDKLHLLTHHTFGRRSDSVDTFIDQLEISKIHAVTEWNGQAWEIRNLGRNGTWVNQQKIPDAKNTALKTGQIINFANQPQNDWRVENLDAPSNLLLGLNDCSITEQLSYYHLLPNSTTPMAALYLCGTRGQWILESHTDNYKNNGSNETVISHNDYIVIGDYKWQLFLNTEQQQTLDVIDKQTNIDHIAFNFDVSLDEEHTQLKLDHQYETIDLGERSHHYLLLHLARLKAEHANQGVDNKSQGWINNEQLAKELGIDVSHINIQIFRARKQIADEFPGATDLLQRRRGEVRFNCSQASISKGDRIESLSY